MKSIKIKILFLLSGLYFTVIINAQTIEVPVIQSVSVNQQTQLIEIKWTVNNPALIDGYVVKRQIFAQSGVVDGSWNTIADISNPNQMSYIDTSIIYGTAQPDVRAENYRIAAYKNISGNIEYSNMSVSVSSTMLDTIRFDACLMSNIIRWSPYSGFSPAMSSYNVYYSLGANSPAILLGTITNGDTSMVHQNILPDTTYYYLVEAFNNSSSDTAYSNIRSISTVIPGNPQIMNADYATVDNFNEISLSFTVDENATIDRYVLLKSDSINGVYDTLSIFPAGTSQITYTDYVKTAQEQYFYKVIAINNCNVTSSESNIASNILLEAQTANDGTKSNILNWTDYKEWLGGVYQYEIYRSVDGSAYQSIAQVPANINTYTDDITNLIMPSYGGQPSKGHFCYYILATEDAGNPYGITGTSKSNISCAHQEAVVWYPNAFNPKSTKAENRSFKPVASFVSDYSLIVYDRNGSIVFKSNNPLEGWDGTNGNGNLLKQGTYIFMLKYRTKNNQLVEKSGQINLVY
ncbi:MAG: gliding motility-associated C-terminal domain-containing protein [Bacteroidales bacterium]|nr:gliding motility-associated C-terminal domain-containing protein [Bacteroidales bacterium]